MKPLGVRTKLALAYAGVLALVLSGLGALSYRTLGARLERSLNQELEERAAGLRGYLHVREGKPALEYDVNDPEQAYFIRTATQFYQVYDAQTGELLEQSRELELLGVELAPAEVQALRRRPRLIDVDTPRAHFRFHNYVLTHGHQHAYLIQVGTSLEPLHATLEEFFKTLLLVVPAGVALAGLLGWWMARQALRPVDALAAGAREISISRLDRRLPLRGTGDELDRLADTFNQVFIRLEKAVEQMKQFTASISHELRTPLTALRGEAEVTLLRARSAEDYRRVLVSQLEEFDKLTQMVNQLLTLARAEAGEIALAFQPVDLSALVQSLTEQLEPVAGWKKVSLGVAVELGVRVEGDPQWLERAVLNLLDNAIKFTPAGGRVQVEVRRSNGQALVDFRDTGVGIAAEALTHVFEPFYRVDPSRSKQIDGAGLGLSLVRWIVEHHHGQVEVESQPGQGSRFTVRLPLARPSS